MLDDLVQELDGTLAFEADGEFEYGEACAYVAAHFQVAADAAGGQ